MLQYSLLIPLFSRVFCTPATSAPVDGTHLLVQWFGDESTQGHE